MAPKANWKGYLKIGELTCPVALYTAASTSDRIAFHTLNRETGHRVQRQFVDSDNGKPVEREDQVKGFEVGENDYVVLEPDEVAAAVPESDKSLSVGAFIASDELDDVYFDKPYYLAPSDKTGEEAFVLIREGLKARKVAALAQTVIFRRARTLLIRAEEQGLIATTLNFDYEVRSAKDAFSHIADLSIKGEMLDLARHIIETKQGTFDPAQYTDRYEAALAELVRAKLEGKSIPAKKPEKPGKVVDLMQALRESAALGKKKTGKSTPRKTAAQPARRKAS
ncbi:MAG: Ku protein [Phyllobacterium sp.]